MGTASQYWTAAREFLSWATSIDPDAVRSRLEILRKFDLSGNGYHQPPSEVSLGLTLGQTRQGMAVTMPSAVAGMIDAAHISLVFHEPHNFLALLLGDEGSPGVTRRMSLLLRSVPLDHSGYRRNLIRLRKCTPDEVLRGVGESFLHPLTAMILPDGDPQIQRELVISLPLTRGAALFRKGIVGEQPLTPGELAAMASAAWDGRPASGQLSGEAPELLQRIAPMDPGFDRQAFTGSGQRFVFFELEPVMTEVAIARLLKIDVDLLLHVELVGDQMRAELLARGRDDSKNPGARAEYLWRQLMLCCKVVRPIQGEKRVVMASHAFQPGASSKNLFGGFPVEDPGMVNWLTRTITNPQLDSAGGSSIFVGKLEGGVPFLFTLGDPTDGGNQHFAAVGSGSAGKSALLYSLCVQTAGTNLVRFAFVSDEHEAFPAMCWQWGSTLEQVSADLSRSGIHLHARGFADGTGEREYVVHFPVGGRDLEAVFRGEVVQSVREFLDSLRIPQDLPLSFRPSSQCNPALLDAAYALIWSGLDPWGVDHFQGLRARWEEAMSPYGYHLCVIFDDPLRDSQGNGTVPNGFSSLARMSVLSAVSSTCKVAHKEGIHAAIAVQTADDLTQRLPGGMNQFHLVFSLETRQIQGWPKHYATITDGKGNELADVCVEFSPQLRQLLGRRKPSASRR